jgi:hypothetical protein|tara:strand:+ start:1000 stop:1182 length:183 start_codon:yes stop_codon:yes gene_type:complete
LEVPVMEYEITIKLKVDTDFFYWGSDPLDRQDIMAEVIHNAMHDIDDVKVTAIRTEEVDR